jgi:hypothetical protein
MPRDRAGADWRAEEPPEPGARGVDPEQGTGVPDKRPGRCDHRLAKLRLQPGDRPAGAQTAAHQDHGLGVGGVCSYRSLCPEGFGLTGDPGFIVKAAAGFAGDRDAVAFQKSPACGGHLRVIGRGDRDPGQAKVAQGRDDRGRRGAARPRAAGRDDGVDLAQVVTMAQNERPRVIAGHDHLRMRFGEDPSGGDHRAGVGGGGKGRAVQRLIGQSAGVARGEPCHVVRQPRPVFVIVQAVARKQKSDPSGDPTHLNGPECCRETASAGDAAVRRRTVQAGPSQRSAPDP